MYQSLISQDIHVWFVLYFFVDYTLGTRREEGLALEQNWEWILHFNYNWVYLCDIVDIVWCNQYDVVCFDG